MSRRFSFLALAILGGAALLAAPPRFVQYPDVKGDRVVFTWDGDLWAGSLAGGAAQRLTTHPGQETHARYSPDGAWIAFSGGFDGGQDVYVMPASGGAPRRLTWRGSCRVQGWSPDGRRILFLNAVEAQARPTTRLYTVDLEGHEPEVLPILKASYGAFTPDGRVLFSTKGTEEYYWKRYKGGQAPDLWIADLQARSYRKLTDYPGRNATGMWYQDTVLFLSDRGPKGVTNLYRLDPATQAATAVTDYADFDVQWPATDGRTVVFTQAGCLMAMDTAARRTWKVDLAVADDGWKRRPRTLNPGAWLHSQSLSRDGRTVALEARGDLFLASTDGKARPRNLTATPGVRERLPVLSPDGGTLAYVSDATGDYDLYVRPAAGGPAVRIPAGISGYFSRLLWSPDGRKLLFGDQSFALYVADVASRKVTKLAASDLLQNDEFTWEQADYAWAPDSTWVAYSFQEVNRHGRIWLHNTQTGQRIPVTGGFDACVNPCFDLDGSRLYFLSHSNMHATLDPTQDNHILDAPVRVLSVALKAKEEGPFRVDADGLSERISVLPVKFGNLFHLRAGRGLVGYSVLDRWDEPANEQLFAPAGADRWQLRLFDVAKGQETALAETVSEAQISADGTSLLVRKGTVLHAGPVADVLKSKALPPRLDLSGLSMTVSPLDEWNQVHAETYRLYRDFFYDKDMHGNDWKAIADKFKAWIPECPSRRNLNWLLSQMVGELCVGHTYVGGGDVGMDVPPPSPVFTGLLGADYEVSEGRYRFAKIYGPTPYERDLKAPLTGLARPGEYLLAIDGTPIKAPDAIHRLLQVVKGQKVRLTINGSPALEGSRTIEVEPLERGENTLRYEAWIAGNIATVEKLSGGQLGYIHTTAMGEQNLGQFDKYWGAFRFRKGLVVDVRGNGGGWTEYFMIDKLERQQVGYNVLRGMVPFRYPGTASDGRYVFLSNEQNGSDGECFLAHVKARNLGPIVGTRSWGGLVGIVNARSTMDGGSINQPNNAFFGRTGSWWIENEGAVPDIPVEDGPDPREDGRQLKTAVEALLKDLQARPTPPFPPRPAYPRR